jgi:hypothetical protein
MNVVKIKREILDEDDNSKEDEGHEHGVGNEIEEVVKEMESAGIVVKIRGDPLQEIGDRVVRPERFLTPPNVCELEIGLRKLGSELYSVTRKLDSPVHLSIFPRSLCFTNEHGGKERVIPDSSVQLQFVNLIKVLSAE